MSEPPFTKVKAGTLPPETAVLVPIARNEWFEKLAYGIACLLKITVPRNYKFHKKWFALVKFAFDNWEPNEEMAAKNFDLFRSEITILAGHYDIVCSLGINEVRKVAKSISWAKMDEEAFSTFYDCTVSAVWKQVFAQKEGYTQQELDRVLNELMSF